MKSRGGHNSLVMSKNKCVVQYDSKCKTKDARFIWNLLSDDLARLPGFYKKNMILAVICQHYKEKVLVFSFPPWTQLFWFSKQQFFQRLHSFEGSQLGYDLPAGQSVCSCALFVGIMQKFFYCLRSKLFSVHWLEKYYLILPPTHMWVP